MNWIKVENYEKMSAMGAGKIYDAIVAKVSKGERVNIGLATGNTMIRLYELLAEKLNENRIPLNLLHTYNLDEYADENGAAVPHAHPLSYWKYMTENLLRRFDPALGFSENNYHFPDPQDPERFDRELEDAGNTDLQLLGIGFNGHIAFNEPMTETELSTDAFAELPSRVIKLKPLTVATNRRLTAGGDDIVPERAVTMGMKQILASGHLLLLACFPEQEEPLKKILHGKPTPELPASYLLRKPDSEIVYCADVISLD